MWDGQVLDHPSAEETPNDQVTICRELLQLVQDQPDRVDDLERLVALADDDPQLVLETGESMIK